MKKIAIILLLFSITFPPSAHAANANNSVPQPDGEYFATIYADGANADSGGFKLLLRASERHSGSHFQPYVVDVNFILKDGDRIIYSDVKRQISIGESIGGSKEIYAPWYVSLDEGKNYTALAELYLYDGGKARYLTTVPAFFTAIMDAAITDIYSDGTGSSATVKGESMVPLDAKIIFTLKQYGRVVEVREAKAPFIMSNDRDKTVDVLWNKSLQPGMYILSTELRGDEVIARYDKAVTVDKLKTAVAPMPTPAAPGFQAFIALASLIAIALVRKDKR